MAEETPEWVAALTPEWVAEQNTTDASISNVVLRDKASKRVLSREIVVFENGIR